MTQLRTIARVIIQHEDAILLVRNSGMNFWYPPGGGWEFADESLIECAKREVKEETNYDVEIDQLIWISEFRENDKVYLESFWKAHLLDQSRDAHVDHIDQDKNGLVTEARWFTEHDLKDLTVFPARIKQFEAFNSLHYNSYLAD